MVAPLEFGNGLIISFHTLLCICDCLFMLGLVLIRVSKRGENRIAAAAFAFFFNRKTTGFGVLLCVCNIF